MSKKIIVVFWGNPFFDGRCMNMIDQLLLQNHEVSVLGIHNKEHNVDYKNATIYFMDTHRFNNRFTKYFVYFKCVKNFIKKMSANIIIASDLYSMIPCAQSKHIHGAKIIYDSRELYTQLGGLAKKPILQKFWSYYEKKYIPNVNHILVSANIDKIYLKNLYLDKIKISVVKNLPGNSFINSSSVDLKEILCLKQENQIFLYQGKFHLGRGIRFSMKCLSKIDNAVLVLIGDGPMKKKYLQAARQHNMEERLFFIDAVPYHDLANFSGSAYIGLSLIQPISKSYEHALPNKLFEYAVMGLPTICSNLTAMKAMIDEYHSGIAINFNSETEFMNAYQEIMSHYNNYVLKKEQCNALLWNSNNYHLNKIISE